VRLGPDPENNVLCFMVFHNSEVKMKLYGSFAERCLCGVCVRGGTVVPCAGYPAPKSLFVNSSVVGRYFPWRYLHKKRMGEIDNEQR